MGCPDGKGGEGTGQLRFIGPIGLNSGIGRSWIRDLTRRSFSDPPCLRFSQTSTSTISSVLVSFSKSRVVIMTEFSPSCPLRSSIVMLVVVAAKTELEVVAGRSRSFFIPPFPNIRGNSTPVAALTTRFCSFNRTNPCRIASGNSGQRKRL